MPKGWTTSPRCCAPRPKSWPLERARSMHGTGPLSPPNAIDSRCPPRTGRDCHEFIEASPGGTVVHRIEQTGPRSEEHTSELQSLRRISYAVFCLKKKK